MFEYKNIALRPIENVDLEFLRRMHNDPTTICNLTDTTLVSEIQQQKWFESICLSESSLRLAVLDEQRDIIGCVRLDHYDNRNRSIQVGGDIAHAYRGKGYGSVMFQACLKYVFDTLNCHRAYLSVLETNRVAIGLYEKYGFKEEGRAVQAIYRGGRYYDYINMYLLCDDWNRSS